MESERLALVGQLSANIAHELNNPLQGIVTFSHLLLEEHKCDDPSYITSLEKIVGQANRCRDIIRGLLDFARQRKPDKAFCAINEVIDECVSLVEYQALFHNIQVIKHFIQIDIFKFIPNLQKINFIETYENKKTTEKKESKPLEKPIQK